MKLKYLLSVFFAIHAVQMHAQENILFGNDIYSGISQVGLSPTQPHLNPNPWDIHLVSSDVFVQNDYLYISNQSFLGLRNSEIRTVNHKLNRTGINTAGVLDYFNEDLASLQVSAGIYGPSFSLSGKMKEFSFRAGMFSRLRFRASAMDLDNYMRFGNQNISEPENYTLQPVNLFMMNWGEMGLNFATDIFLNSDLRWVVGANLKYLAGFDAVTIESRQPLNLIRTEEMVDGEMQKTITMSNYDIHANYATSYDFDGKKYQPGQNGNGLGFDFGIAVVEPMDDELGYNFKLGINLLDVGQISFQGATHRFNGKDIKVVNNPELENIRFDSPEKILNLISKQAYGDETKSFTGTDFKIGLPTALHINFSKNLGNDRYFNVNYFQRTPVFDNSLRNPNILSTSISVQKPYFAYGASVSLYEYQRLQFGGYLRLGPLILGSENFLPLFIPQKRLQSGDFYIALKLYPFWDNELKRHRRAKCNCD